MKTPLAALFLSLPLLALACGGSTTDTTGSGNDAGSTSDAAGTDSGSGDDGGTSDANPGVDGGSVLIPDDATIVLRNKGGFAAQGSDTSVCTVEDEAYSFVLATGHITWKVCEFEDGGANGYAVGERDIAAADAAPLKAALAAIKITTDLKQGADKPEETLEVDSPNALAPTTYYDDFYHVTNDGKIYVSGLDDVRSQLVKLAVHATK